MYILTGNNHDVGSDTYIPTEIHVKKGVKATLYLKDLSIDNRDGKTGWCGYEGFTTPFVNDGEVSIVLLSDSVFSRENAVGASPVLNNGTITVENSLYTLSILAQGNNLSPIESGYNNVLNLKGSTLRLSASIDYGNLSIFGGRILSDTYAVYTGKAGTMIVDGGCWKEEPLDTQYSNSYVSSQGKSLVMSTLTGLPANQSITLMQQNKTSDSYTWDYNTAGVVTDENGEVNIACLEGMDKLLLKCNGEVYECTYNQDSQKWDAAVAENTQLHKLTYKDIDTGEVLYEGTLSKYGYSEMVKELKKYDYSYYKTTDVSGAVFDFGAVDSDSVVYVKRNLRQYTITVNGNTGLAPSYTLYYGETIPDSEGYVFVRDNGTAKEYWDGVVTDTITVTAYPGISVNNTRYYKIDSLSDLNKFAELVNSGAGQMNGYLTKDIDAGNFKGIGTQDNKYCGTFEGNHHTINLSIDGTGDANYRALFRHAGKGVILNNITTSGSIVTNGQFAAGIVSGIWGECRISNCKSSINITFACESYGDASCGGVVGLIETNASTELNNCWYTGKMAPAAGSGTGMFGMGGLIGHRYASAYANNCLVNATFDSAAMNPGETFIRENGQINNCYFTSRCGASYQGIQISEEAMNTPEFAWNLNSTNGTSNNSGAWSYTDTDKLTYADAAHFPICKVKFVDSGEHAGTALAEESAFSAGETGNVSMPDVTSVSGGMKKGEALKWCIGDTILTQNTVITSDCTANLKLCDIRHYDITGSAIENSTIITNKAKTEIALSNIPSSGVDLIVRNSAGEFRKELDSTIKCIKASDITINGSSLTNLNDCSVWIETTQNNETYAIKATSGKGYDTHTVSGSNMTLSTDSGLESQTDKFSKITDIIYTADDGYYFPQDYVSNIAGLTDGTRNGITVRRDSESRLIISGTATADTNIILPDAVKKVSTISASVSEKDFGIRNEKYQVPNADKTSVTITNTGNQTIDISKINPTHYIVSELSKGRLAPGETATFTIQPESNLPEGIYNEAVKVNTSNGTSTTVNAKFKVNKELTVGIAPASPSIIEGESQKLTANTTGGSGSYTYKWYKGNDAAVIGTTKEITVSPLSTATYKVVVNDTIEAKSATTDINVTSKNHSINASVSELDFGSKNESYTVPEAKSVIVTNTGNQTADLTQIKPEHYNISDLSKTTLLPGETATFTVQPKADLTEGIYNEAVVVNTSNEASVTVNVKLKVNKKLNVVIAPYDSTIIKGESQKLTVSATGGSGSYTYKWYKGNDTEIIGTAKEVTVTPSDTTTYKVVVNDTIEDITEATTVNVKPKNDSFDLSTTEYDFGSESEGYSSIEPKEVSIKNTGNQTLNISAVNPENYVVSDISKTNLLPGETASFTVSPKAELNAGRYDESVVINMGNGMRTAVKLNFIVNKFASPKNAKASVVSYNKIKVTWEKADNATEYRVYMYNSELNKNKKVFTVKGTKTVISNVLPGTKYVFRVIAIRSSNGKTYRSNYSNKVFAMPVLNTVTNLKVSNSKTKQSLISWNKVYGANGYLVYRSTKKDSGYRLITTLNKGSKVKYSNRFLRKGKTYYYKVKAYRTVNGKMIYSSVSKTVKVKINV